jgi:hypothetical protein
MPSYPNYNPQGALGGTFAPAYIPGYAPSEQAVMQRQSTRGLRGIMNQGVQYLEELRGPPPQNQLNNFGQGQWDPAMLRAMAQNLPYDVGRRRSEIAGVLANRPATPTAEFPYGNWSVAGQVGPEFGASLQQLGLMPANLTYNNETRTWV